jgi:hypothetical protein
LIVGEFAGPPQDPGGQPFRFGAGYRDGSVLAGANPPAGDAGDLCVDQRMTDVDA